MPEIWIPDMGTYNSIQKIKGFVNFVANTKYATKPDKETAEEIVSLIENIDKRETHKDWMVCLDILNSDPDYHYNRKSGVYWREWSVTFENYTLTIEAKTNHTDEPLFHWGNDFEYYGEVYFERDVKCERVRLDKPIENFVEDAMRYEIYMNELMNIIELDFYISG